MSKNEFRLSGTTLRTLRTIYRLKQLDISDMLNVHQSHVALAERGQRSLTAEQTSLFLNEIDMSVETAKQFDIIIRQITDRIEYEQIAKRLRL